MVKDPLKEVTWDIIHRINTQQEFPLVEGVSEPKYGRIYPLMQREVQSIVETLKDVDVTVLIFGSALTMRCSAFSDIDICIKTKEYNKSLFELVRTKISNVSNTSVDIVYYNELPENDKLKCEIDTKGFEIYGGVL